MIWGYHDFWKHPQKNDELSSKFPWLAAKGKICLISINSSCRSGEVFNEHGASSCMLRTTETASTSTSITIAFDTNGLLLKSDLAALFVVGKYPFCWDRRLVYIYLQ